MRIHRVAGISLPVLLVLSPAALSQDSVSISGCFNGDATSPWDDQFGPFGSEQCDTYVVDLTPVVSSWGNTFGVAPVAKSGQSDPGIFFSSLMGGTGISRDTLTGQKFSAATYSFWDQAGFGVNNDPSVNTPGALVDATTLRGTQFAIVFQDNGFTSGGSAYAGVVTAVVNVDPSNPGRLYVNKVRAGTNSCDMFSDLAAIGVGSVDANGNVVFRADSFGVLLGGCGASIVQGNNVFVIDSLGRNCSLRNHVSATPSLYDAMSALISNSPNTITTPALMPESIAGGGDPILLAVDFNSNFYRGTNSGNIVSDGTYLDPQVTAGTRGGPTYLSKNWALLNSTHGICGMIGDSAGTIELNLWGLDSGGNPTATVAYQLPPLVIDNDTGFQNATSVGGPNEFDNYHSQVAFQGGNGQAALNIDPLGNLIIAAQVDHPDDGPDNQWGGNYIAVCRVDPVSGAASWTMAGYIDPVTTNGKPILDGPNGIAVAQMKMLFAGPSVSSPMVDEAGNVYFLSFIEKLDGSGDTSVGLIKAVYDPVNFSYRLELLLETGQVIHGQNSNRDYLITSLRLTDSNSIASDAPWSQSISERSFLGFDGSCFAPSDPRTLGGIAVAANISYDHSQDGAFDGDDCLTAGSTDEEYRVILYVGALGESGSEVYGQGCPGTGGFEPVISWDGYPATGKTITLSIDSALGGQTALLFLSFTGQAAIPVGSGCLLNINTPVVGPFPLPLLGVGAGNGAISVTTPLPPVPPGLKMNIQAFCTDPSVPIGASATKGLEITFQS